MKDVNGWMVPDFDRVIAKQCKVFPETTYQQDILNWALSHSKSFNTAVDVGANVGLHSVRLSQRFNKVIAFEPYSLNFECLILNTMTFSNIDLNNKGLGAEKSSVEISLPTDSDNGGAPSIVDFLNTERKLVNESIQIDTLDSYNLAPDLIKIDTQGYELQVLKGAYETLKKYKPVLIVEVGKGEPLNRICEYLSEFGYELDGHTNKDKGFRVPEQNAD